MSHDATNWAIKQRGLKPAAKIVLWHLCDRHHPDHGCFPSQETLAEDCEMPRSTLNVYLEALENAGLIARERRRRQGNARQESTRYRFAFEPGFTPVSAEKPSPETGHGSEGDTESRNEAEPSPENGESRVQNLDSNPVREPVIEPVREREAHASANGGDRDESDAALMKRVKALELGRKGNPWPGAAGSSTQWAMGQFRKLEPAERLQAEERRDAYLDLCKEQKIKPVALGVYLRDRKFLDVEGRKPAGEARVSNDGTVRVAVFGPAWAAARMAALAEAPLEVELPLDLRDRKRATYEALARTSPSRAQGWAMRNGLSTDARGELLFPDDFERQESFRLERDMGWPVANALSEAKDASYCTVPAIFERCKDLCEPVPIGCDLYQRWMDWHRAHNRPLPPEPSAMKVMFFPRGGPERMGDFVDAIRQEKESGDAEHAA